jgi:hypothetical protein
MFIAILKTPGTQTAHIVFLYEPEVDAQNSPDIATTLSTYVSPSVMRSSKADPERLRVGKPLKRKQSDTTKQGFAGIGSLELINRLLLENQVF